ncbi:MAG TPA: ribosome assembly RNA-binding protein YhbY [Clostridiales bacterium]|nr:ribosome assembly RNA-binding protein YhbY [Clostridiales bacterium]
MLTSRQRARLRAMANPMGDVLLIGKEGLTEAVLTQAEAVLEKHELIKIKILETAMLSPREVQAALCEQLDAEPVQCIGTKTVIFRTARDPENRHINPDA